MEQGFFPFPKGKVIFQIFLFAFLILFFSPTSCLAEASGAGPGTASTPTSLTPLKPSGLGSSKSPLSSSKSGLDANSSSDFQYKTDSETDRLQQAIETYNRSNPNDPIVEFSNSALEKLFKAGLLSDPIRNSSNIVVLKDGSVFRRVPRSQGNQPTGGTGVAANSFFDSFEGTSAALNTDSPKKTPEPPASKEIKMEDRTVKIRLPNSENRDVKFTLPVIPKPLPSKPKPDVSTVFKKDFLRKVIQTQRTIRAPTIKRMPVKLFPLPIKKPIELAPKLQISTPSATLK
ncbi:hypothetical protein HYY75_04040 [bacterium]|nr:hypothetical protein [bacterium]